MQQFTADYWWPTLLAEEAYTFPDNMGNGPPIHSFFADNRLLTAPPEDKTSNIDDEHLVSLAVAPTAPLADKFNDMDSAPCTFIINADVYPAWFRGIA